MFYIKHSKFAATVLAILTITACNNVMSPTEDERIQRAKDAEARGDLKTSEIELKNALQHNPDLALARLLLGQLYLKQGRGADAEKELIKARSIGIDVDIIQPLLGESYLLQDKYTELLDEIQATPAMSSSNQARILQLRGSALIAQGRLADGCALFADALGKDPERIQTLWGLAHCAIANKNHDDAKRHLDSAIKIDDKNPKSWLMLGDFAQMRNDAMTAYEAYQTALRLEPAYADAHVALTNLYLKEGKRHEARTQILNFVKLDPNNIRAKYLQALLNFLDGQYKQASEHLYQVLRANPGHEPTILLSGMVYTALGNLENAQTHFKKLLSKYPGYEYVRKMLAIVQLQGKQPSEALKTLEPFLSPLTTDAEALALIGETYRLLNQPAEAARYYELAAQTGGADLGLRAHLGVTRLALGDTARGYLDLEMAAAQDAQAVKLYNFIIALQIARQDYDLALQTIDRLSKTKPQDHLLHYYKGLAYFGKRDLKNARSFFQRALQLNTGHPPTYIALSHIDLKEGNVASAKSNLATALKHDPKNADAVVLLAEIAASEGKHTDYVRYLEDAAKIDPLALRPRQLLVRTYISAGNTDKAMRVAKDYYDRNPDDANALELLATTQMAAGQKDSALSNYIRLVDRNPSSAEPLKRLAGAQTLTGQSAAARDTLYKALKLAPNDLSILVELIRLETHAKRYDAAIKLATDIDRQQPKSPLGPALQGDILMAAGRFQEAAKAYAIALRRDPQQAMLINARFNAQVRSGQAKAAIEELLVRLSRSPSDITSRLILADYYAAIGQHSVAIEHYNNALKLDPHNIAILNNLALASLQAGDPKAVDYAEQAYRRQPKNAAVLDTYGWVLAQRGDLNRALPLLREAARKAPGIPTVRYHLAATLDKAGDKEGARKEVDAAIKSGVSFPELDQASVLQRKLHGD